MTIPPHWLHDSVGNLAWETSTMKRTLSVVLLVAASLCAQKSATYFPPSGAWQKKAPAEVGLDPAKLQAAVDWALAHGSTWDFEKDQVRTFGMVLGALPKQRASTNGIIL